MAFGETSAILSPDGTTIAAQDHEVISFIPLACRSSACDTPPKQLTNAGTLMTWTN